ncbi:MAG: hypothetical protein V1909_00910 [Candidatus Micrarchaeota archaeon]
MAKKANGGHNARMVSMCDTIVLCIGIVDREKAGKGPENPETLRKLLDDHKDTLITSIKLIKDGSVDERREMINDIEELLEKFDSESLRTANKLICGIIDR